ncbi:uncharacterized protein LOC125381460 [Haliotis rufescens]|uniref:uncharacterized protein LOC125381460 n=1 Tax=Haliotis rufescens TaxID=6454 RepID=UPI00201F236C|nr:uncharacterized protein LOC125381460 [Haliotis rufescens]
MSEQEITDELTTEGVTAVKRFTMKSRDGDIITSNTHLLTFALSALPKSIEAGYLNIGVEVYVPNTLRCFTCQKFGHGSKSCNHSVFCQRCGGGHDNTNCTAEPETVEPATIESAVVTLTRKERQKLNRKQRTMKSSSSEVLLHKSFDALDMDVTPSSQSNSMSPSSSRARERSPIEPQ